MAPSERNPAINPAPLEGRTAIITGAARGIGYAVAERFTDAGATCVLLDVDRISLKAATTRITGADSWPCDVADRDQVLDTIAAIEADHGAIDILVNNAGIWRHTPVLDVSETEWDHIQSVNTKSILFCSQAVAPGMRHRGSGKIVNIASQAGFTGSSPWSAYSASKAATISLTLSLANALSPYGVHVNAVCPGAVETALTDQIRRDEPGSAFEHALSPSVVAGTVLQLVSPFHETTGGRIIPTGEPDSVLGIPVHRETPLP